jgi:hypothetical protein
MQQTCKQLEGQASKMCCDMFGVSAPAGGDFAGLLSIFNLSVSDYTGCKSVYCISSD